ncbi:MAG: HupE/UreJ family protein [Gammaproteobacteria bacterium]
MNRKLLSITALIGASPLAWAHHPLGGAPMETFLHGLLSGIGHPILGFDHFFFLIAVGIAVVFTRNSLILSMFFIVSVLAGVALMLAGITLPQAELVIAASLLIVGGIVVAGKALSLPIAVALFTGLGIFHGWAFGESIIGQESLNPTVVSGYLAGLAMIQWMIVSITGVLVSKIWHVAVATDLRPRLAGAMVSGVGLALLLEHLEALLFVV